MQDEVTRGTRRWKAPPPDSVSLMVDGAHHAVHQRMGIRGLVRDSEEKWLGGFYAGRSGGDPLFAEIQALLQGLKFLWQHN